MKLGTTGYVKHVPLTDLQLRTQEPSYRYTSGIVLLREQEIGEVTKLVGVIEKEAIQLNTNDIFDYFFGSKPDEVNARRSHYALAKTMGMIRYMQHDPSKRFHFVGGRFTWESTTQILFDINALRY